MKTEIVKVHNTKIECPYENEQHYVAVRSICQALGIDYRKQFERIKSDPDLCDVVTHTVTAPDKSGRKQEMFCLPLKFVFGWLFSIDSSKVNEKSKVSFRRYRMECYNALYEHFYLRTALYERKEKMIAEKKLQILQAETEKISASEKISNFKKELREIEDTPVMQLSLFSAN